MCETKGSQWFLKGSQQKLEHGLESMTPIDYNKGQIFYNRNSLLCVIEGHNTVLLKVFLSVKTNLETNLKKKKECVILHLHYGRPHG